NDVLNRLAEMAGVDDRLSGQDVAVRLVGRWIRARVGVRGGLRVGHRVRRRARGGGVLSGVRVPAVCRRGGGGWGVVLGSGVRGWLGGRWGGVGACLWMAVGAALRVSAQGMPGARTWAMDPPSGARAARVEVAPATAARLAGACWGPARSAGVGPGSGRGFRH